MKIKCRIIGFDLDGTLLNSEKHIAEHTREVLTRAVDRESGFCRSQEDHLADCQKKS